jgi:DNA-binding transcriptional regulator YiaG
VAEDWADRIKVLRLSLGLSQAEFGAILGVTFQTVNRWEKRHFEPSECDKALITFIETDQEAAEKILSYPITETAETFGQRVKRVRESLGLGRELFGRLLRVDRQTLTGWEKLDRSPSSSCALRLIDLLEFHREEAAPYFWPQLPEAEKLEELSQRRDPCQRFMERLNAESEEWRDLIETIQVDAALEPDRVMALRKTLGLSRSEFAHLLGTKVWNVANMWEVDGIRGRDPRSHCWRLILTLFERYPREMMAIRETWPMFI